MHWTRVATPMRKAVSPQVLVAQTSGKSTYMRLLDATRATNEAYALRNGFDYLAATGLFAGDQERHATFNKVFLLEAALADGRYDVLFSLDSDALVVNASLSPSDFLPHNGTLLAACRGASNVPHTWDVNAGVLIWNLRHPHVRAVSREWVERSLRAIGRGTNNDQAELHTILHRLTPREREEWLNVYVGEEAGLFNYDGVHVKHFIRPDGGDWTGNTVPARAREIEAFVRARGPAAGLAGGGGR